MLWITIVIIGQILKIPYLLTLAYFATFHQSMIKKEVVYYREHLVGSFTLAAMPFSSTRGIASTAIQYVDTSVTMCCCRQYHDAIRT